jgi:hypothetical protein
MSLNVRVEIKQMQHTSCSIVYCLKDNVGKLLSTYEEFKILQRMLSHEFDYDFSVLFSISPTLNLDNIISGLTLVIYC